MSDDTDLDPHANTSQQLTTNGLEEVPITTNAPSSSSIKLKSNGSILFLFDIKILKNFIKLKIFVHELDHLWVVMIIAYILIKKKLYMLICHLFVLVYCV